MLVVDPAFWAGRRVFVTGHTGFKGAWLTFWLRQMGSEVVGYALPPATTPSLFGLLDLRHDHFADICDTRALEDAMRSARPEIVLHLAAQALVRPSFDDPVGTFATNIVGTAALLDAVRKTDGVRAVVIVTSDKCYENREWAWGYRETDALGGHDPYSASKGAAEIVTASMRQSFFAPYRAGGHPARIATARAGNVIGGGDWSTDRLVPGDPALAARARASRRLSWPCTAAPCRRRGR
jgi:CDP-glucose 4,6-dehydratase